MADPGRIRALISSSKKPIVFRGLVDTWPMINFTQNDWMKFFENKQLDCRVGTKSRGAEPQWETQSVNVHCTYCELVQWTENVAGGECDIAAFDPNRNFLYFAYKHMKDVFDKEVLEMIDWGYFGYPGRDGSESTFWLGTPGAHTPCHYDTYGCNLVAQITGRKRWILYPPEDTELLRPTRVPYEESSVYSRINFEQWPDCVPSIKGSHPHIVELVPGDVLFVPRHWWHHVCNQELSISINTWVEMPDVDADARFHEALVKFLVAHTCRNVSPHELFDLLNPNEEEMADADLVEIQGFVKHSLMLKSQVKQSDSSSFDVQKEEWFTPVVCSAVPDTSDGDVSQPGKEPADVCTLDVIRAFTDPRVIKVVADILEENI